MMFYLSDPIKKMTEKYTLTDEVPFGLEIVSSPKFNENAIFKIGNNTISGREIISRTYKYENDDPEILESDTTWKNNQEYLIFSIYDPSGRIKSIDRYTNNKKDGISTSYHENGRMSILQHWINNDRTGPYKRWDKDGNLLEECVVIKGWYHGKRRLWHSNGQLKKEYHVLSEECLWQSPEYDENGKVVLKEDQ